MKKFSKLTFIILFVLVFTSVILKREAFSTSTPPPCYKYSYSDKYIVNNETLPEGVSVVEHFGKTPFLINNSQNILLIKNGGLTIKLIGGLEYGKHNIEGVTTSWVKENQEYSNARIPSLIAVGNSRISNIPNIYTYSSNDQPKNPKPVNFEIHTIYNGEPRTISGTLSYNLIEKDCPINKDNSIKQRSNSVLLDKIIKLFSLLKFW